MHVISRQDPHGDNFKILGIEFDCKLLMHSAVRQTADSASWKLRSVMRSSRFFTHSDIILHYKSHILSFVEYRTAGIYHACTSVLQVLDSVQTSFLRELSVSEVEALVYFNLAPLQSRRDMAMLGIIHRSVIGKGPDHFSHFFVREEALIRHGTRRSRRRHDKQLKDPRGPRFSEQLRRSALGLVAIYNLLPQEIVDAPFVSVFQSLLQSMLKDFAVSAVPDWQDLFSPRVPIYRHLLR